jgi:ABC-type glycerol-3-phosphate transport system permease component
MFSTTLTVVDGFPRAISILYARLRAPEEPGSDEVEHPATRRVYWGSLAVIGVGSILVLVMLLKSLKAMVDLATTLSFLTAPMLAWLNHRAILGAEVPDEARPSKALAAFSLVCVVVLTAFAGYYLKLRFFS